MSKLLSNGQLVQAFAPVNLATGANTGDWVSLKDYRRLLAVLMKGAGTAGEDPVITLKQATDAAGTGAKALPFTAIYAKVGAQAGIGTFTKVETDASAGTYVDAVSAEVEATFAVEIRAEQLDVDNGYAYVQLSIPKVGASAQIGAGYYLLTDPRYAQETPVSAIT